jgi:hypothetical protein
MEKFKTLFSHRRCIYTITNENLDFAIETGVHNFYSLKLDEIIIEQRIRWNPENNEFIGTCYKHKDSIDYSNYVFLNRFNILEIKDA